MSVWPECCGERATRMEITRPGKLPMYGYCCEKCERLGPQDEDERKSLLQFEAGMPLGSGTIVAPSAAKMDEAYVFDDAMKALRDRYRGSSDMALKPMAQTIMELVKRWEGKIKWSNVPKQP